jgi:hypothetical protein
VSSGVASAPANDEIAGRFGRLDPLGKAIQEWPVIALSGRLEAMDTVL